MLLELKRESQNTVELLAGIKTALDADTSARRLVPQTKDLDGGTDLVEVKEAIAAAIP